MIVNGFVRASTAGFASDFAVAREFLTPQAAAKWDPTEQVIVFDSGALTPTFDAPTNTVTYEIPVKATVDASGHLIEAADGTRETLSFAMQRDDEGQWTLMNAYNNKAVKDVFIESHMTGITTIKGLCPN